MFYQDLSGQPFLAKPLRSRALSISDKPDCLMRTAEGTVPVEFMHSSPPPVKESTATT